MNAPSANKEIPVSRVSSGRTVASALEDTGLADSLPEARRLISQGKVKVDGRPVTDVNYLFDAVPGAVLQVGKRTARLTEG
ncbi:MAG: S4 domain-containing protein [Candidatus Dormibacteria bacterium]